MVYYSHIEYIKENINDYDKIQEVVDKMDFLVSKDYTTQEMVTLDNQLVCLKEWYRVSYKILFTEVNFSLKLLFDYLPFYLDESIFQESKLDE